MDSQTSFFLFLPKLSQVWLRVFMLLSVSETSVCVSLCMCRMCACAGVCLVRHLISYSSHACSSLHCTQSNFVGACSRVKTAQTLGWEMRRGRRRRSTRRRRRRTKGERWNWEWVVDIEQRLAWHDATMFIRKHTHTLIHTKKCKGTHICYLLHIFALIQYMELKAEGCFASSFLETAPSLFLLSLSGQLGYGAKINPWLGRGIW